MKTPLWLIPFVFLSIATETEAQRYCGEGRWVNNQFVCPPTTGERIETELRGNTRILREQQRTLKEIERSNRAIENRPQPQQQTIIIKEPQIVEKSVVEKPEPAPPQSVYKWQDEKGIWHFQSAPAQ